MLIMCLLLQTPLKIIRKLGVQHAQMKQCGQKKIVRFLLAGWPKWGVLGSLKSTSFNV